jgi:NADH-quinone oxidoreductase subunit L
MMDLLWLVPTFPLAGFLALSLFGQRFSRGAIAVVGVGSVSLSAALAISIGTVFILSPPVDNSYTQDLWTWINLGQLAPKVAFYLDALAVCMILVVTVVGFLIHLYSAEYMMEDDGFSRFFAYMNLFVASMLTLVLADNLFLFYLGWEGVGLCSFLLIGFWYKDPDNVRAAIKAFVITRIGDTALVIGLFLLFSNLGTLEIQELMRRASQEWAVGSGLAVAAAALLLGGAVGKSAQIPLQTWLPDAMAGPTPVSALIHAATMVTAGVYLIARTNVLFSLAPVIQSTVAIIGLATLLVSGFSALTQSDIKRVLAYSTISQIGYMFLALGVGAWSAAIFHFLTHAFFKSLLFLAAGSIIIAAGHEQNIFKLGGVRERLPVTFWTFLIGAASLSALPLVTSGFYSKEMILWGTWASDKGGPWLWAGGVLGALLTSLYAFRMIFLVCFGKEHTPLERHSGNLIRIPLVVLALFSLVAGLIDLPHSFGNFHVFSDFLSAALPPVHVVKNDLSAEIVLQIIAGLASVVGILISYLLFLRYRDYSETLALRGPAAILHGFWFSGWGFDRVYKTLIVDPFVRIARLNRNDFIDSFYTLTAMVTQSFHHGLSLTQTGNLRQYALGIALGAIVTLGILALL